MDFLLCKYGLIFTEFDSIDRGGAEVNTFKFSKYRIAGNFCGVFISAILRFLLATAELKNRRIFFLYYFISGHPYVGADITCGNI